MRLYGIVQQGMDKWLLVLYHIFIKIIATDINDKQIQYAIQHDRIQYHIIKAEETNHIISNESIDFITVGQALHWFDFPLFFHEVQRVLKSNIGILAVWSYDMFIIPADDNTQLNVAFQ